MRQWLQSSTAEPNECVGLELSRFRVTPGNQDSRRGGEVKKPNFGLPNKHQSICKSDEGISKEIRAHSRNFGASDGRNGGLAMLWHEGGDVFMSCSNSHIDVAVHSANGANPWRATRFLWPP